MLDLRIRGRKALVCAASKGLGRACAMSLGRAGVELTITAPTPETPQPTPLGVPQENRPPATAGSPRTPPPGPRPPPARARPPPPPPLHQIGGAPPRHL